MWAYVLQWWYIYFINLVCFMTCCHWMARKHLKLSHVSKQRLGEKQQVFRGSSLQSCFHRPVKFTKNFPSNLLFHLSLTTTLQGKLLLSFYRWRDWNLERNDLFKVGGDLWQDMTTSWPMSTTWAIGGSHPSATLGDYTLPTLPTVGAAFKHAALRECVLLRPSGCYMWLDPVQASI